MPAEVGGFKSESTGGISGCPGLAGGERKPGREAGVKVFFAFAI